MTRGWRTTDFPAELLDAFRARIGDHPDDEHRCWLWPGGTSYGYFSAGGYTARVHRLSYAAFNGNPPADLLVRHTCDTPACFNPQHLLLGTDQDNADDKATRGRSVIEDRHPARKLTSDRARQLAEDYVSSSESLNALAARYGVNSATVRALVERKTWRNATAGIDFDAAPMRKAGQRGATHHAAKLTAVTAREVACGYIAGVSLVELSARFGVSRGTVRDVTSRRCWREATDGLGLEAVDGRARQAAALPKARAAARKSTRQGSPSDVQDPAHPSHVPEPLERPSTALLGGKERPS